MTSKVANDNGSRGIMYLREGMEAGLKILCSFPQFRRPMAGGNMGLTF